MGVRGDFVSARYGHCIVTTQQIKFGGDGEVIRCLRFRSLLASFERVSRFMILTIPDLLHKKLKLAGSALFLMRRKFVQNWS